tara:strand:+ start:3991 stop:4509 length:519 start_codon:yes stop_codon:yes gene_type:complete
MNEGIVTKHSSISQILEDFGNEVLGKFKSNLERDNAIASGALYQKMTFRSTIMGTEFHFVLDMGVDYWKAVDEGRGPTKKAGGNLFNSILTWVNTKATFGGFQNVQNISDKAVQRGLAYVIARKIHKKGTKGNNFYSSVITEQRLDKLKKDLSAAASGDLKTVITESFKKLK